MPPLSEATSTTKEEETSAKPTLRRATYIEIRDLAKAYNIDVESLQPLPKETSRPSVENNHGNNFVIGNYNFGKSQQRPQNSGYNLCVLVGDIDIVVDKFRVDGSRVRLAEVEVGDESGIISLRARDDQIDILQSIASSSNHAAVLRNCTMELYQGKHLRLAVTKWGKLTPYPDHVASTPNPPGSLNRDVNLSLVDVSSLVENRGRFGSCPESPSGREQKQDGRNVVAEEDPKQTPVIIYHPQQTTTPNATSHHHPRHYRQQHHQHQRNDYYNKQQYHSRPSSDRGGVMLQSNHPHAYSYPSSSNAMHMYTTPQPLHPHHPHRQYRHNRNANAGSPEYHHSPNVYPPSLPRLWQQQQQQYLFYQQQQQEQQPYPQIMQPPPPLPNLIPVDNDPNPVFVSLDTSSPPPSPSPNRQQASFSPNMMIPNLSFDGTAAPSTGNAEQYRYPQQAPLSPMQPGWYPARSQRAAGRSDGRVPRPSSYMKAPPQGMIHHHVHHHQIPGAPLPYPYYTVSPQQQQQGIHHHHHHAVYASSPNPNVVLQQREEKQVVVSPGSDANKEGQGRDKE